MVERRHTAEDAFPRYFAEKLWEMVPTVYKIRDGASDNPTPGALRGLVEIIAEQAAILRRSHDRLWEDQFVDTADDWAVPYIADLIATRLVSASNPAGRRVDVAKTIYYRRRKGTLPILEELIADIARWEGKTVEMFRRVARARHRLDPDPFPEAGRFSGTLPGGWADLRDFGAARAAHGPFDEYHHTPDVRKYAGGMDGRYGIAKLAFHLYRLKAFRVNGATPRPMDGTTGFTIDPSGRDAPLFMPRNRASRWAAARGSALEWELPARIPLRLLDDAQFLLTEGVVRRLEGETGLSASGAGDLRALRGIRFRSEERFRETLGSLESSAELLDPVVYHPLATHALLDDCGKAALLPDDSGQPTLTSDALEVTEAGRGLVTRQSVIGDGLGAWSSGASAPERRLVVDPSCGRLLFLDGPDGAVTVDYHYGFAAEIGAGTYDRRLCLAEDVDAQVDGGGDALDAAHLLNDGVTQVNDSATYGPASDKLAVRHLSVQAANGERPYILPGPRWAFNAGKNTDARATLDGLWVGGGGKVVFRAERDGGRGSYERVTIRHCTFDPGGTAADGSAIAPLPLVIDCRIEELIVQRSILSSIRATENGAVERLVICDSILDPVVAAAPAIDMHRGNVVLKRVTSFGEIRAHRLRATDLLAASPVTVTDTQQGCFRFSAAPAGGRLPMPYRSVELTDIAGLFTSRRFSDPDYAQLRSTAPASVSRGAEDGSEMGAFGAEKGPIKLDSLVEKAGEHMPFGMIPLLITES